MLQRATQSLALTAALTAVLVGLARHWEFWSVVKRAGLAYFVAYAGCGLLLVLTRLALEAEPAERRGSTRPAGKGRGTDGTDAAV